jgi:glycosyltransferase involved in cell wall biosynthesis
MVCNESKDLYSLVSFLKKVRESDDEINILIDTNHVSNSVERVIEYFKDDIVVNRRGFDGDFSAQRNYQIEKCSGEYIFLIDPDEMPQEKLIVNMKKMIEDSNADMVVIPRINICPGFTDEWLKLTGFNVNQAGWINWPDCQTRIIKNIPTIRYSNKLHERLTGFKNPINLNADPTLALWHIKSVEKQDNRWDYSDGSYTPTDGRDVYDSLM